MQKENSSFLNHTLKNNYLAELYEQVYDRLFSQSTRLGYSYEQTEDFIQQLFLTFSEKAIQFNNIKNPEAFVVTCFKRKLIDNYRSVHQKKNGKFIFVDEHESPSSTTHIIEEKEDRINLSLRLKNAYDGLPDRYKSVVYYKYAMGLSNEEISQKTGLTLRTIYNNLHNAIKMMRNELK